MASETNGTTSAGSVEALKRVKATESEWDTRISTTRAETEATLRRLKEEVDTAVKTAHAEAERERNARLEEARAATENEAGAILAEGRTAAERAARGEGRRPADKKDALLDAVLGSFRKS